jgi:hypothetical protein
VPTFRPGDRLRSTTSETEVVIVKAPDGEVDLRCGGRPMVPVGEAGEPAGAPAPPFDQPTLTGKRYESEALGLQVLCTKGGAGSLSVGEEPLVEVGAKPLPASD